MTIRKLMTRYGLLLVTTVLFLSCSSSSTDANLEEARFLLDRGDFAGAEVKARAALAAEPDNNDAKFLLATALIGESFLGNGRTYLGLLADVQEDKVDGQSDFETFTRIAPVLSGNTLSQLQEARDTLISIPASERTHDMYLQLYVTRLFEIATVNSQIGAQSDDLVCNKNEANPKKDGVPDEFDPTALGGDAATRFQDNVDNINSDGENAGLPSSFALNDRMTSIGTDLAAEIIAAGGDAQVGAQNYLTKQFCEGLTVCDESICTVDK